MQLRQTACARDQARIARGIPLRNCSWELRRRELHNLTPLRSSARNLGDHTFSFFWKYIKSETYPPPPTAAASKGGRGGICKKRRKTGIARKRRRPEEDFSGIFLLSCVSHMDSRVISPWPIRPRIYDISHVKSYFQKANKLAVNVFQP